jgi:cellulose synthase/poly-beta-1,6-N-acetylglucosamine synthase-like glycosyltransferase
MAPSPILSVLLPVRNGESFLQDALVSLQEQTVEAIEVLAVDDGSTDGTEEILRGVAREDPRVRVLSQEAKGIVGALEAARIRSRGRYLARMDADDLAHKRRFEAQLEMMAADTRLVATGTGVEYFPRDQVRGGALRYEGWINALTSHEAMVRDLFVECPLPHPTLLLRADVLEWVGGYRETTWPEDYDLVLRLWEGGGRFGKVAEPLLRWREGPDRLSRTHPTYAEEAFRRCKVHFLLRSHLAGGRGVVIWGAGPVGKAFARELQAQGGRLRAFVDLSPRKQGQEIHGVRVVTPDEAGRFTSELHLAAVAQPGGREVIRSDLTRMGKTELEDFLAVA